MAAFVLKRLLNSIPVLLGVTFISFLLIYAAPGDPVRILAPQAVSEQDIQRVRESYHLDEPFIVQYGRFLLGLVQGDLGRTISQPARPVASVVFGSLGVTAALAVLAIALAVFIGLAAGVFSSTRPNSIFDRLSMAGALAGISMPVFWLGMMLQMYAARPLGLPLTYDPWRAAASLVLPAITLGAFYAALIARVSRSAMLEVLGSDYIRTARAKGLGPWDVTVKHGLRNALIPIVTVIGTSLGSLLTGAVLTETVFCVPGLGREMVSAILARDFNLLRGVVLVMAVIFIVVNLLVDVLYAYLDPRIRSIRE
jgi:peptide/nickel transport system permease protein